MPMIRRFAVLSAAALFAAVSVAATAAPKKGAAKKKAPPKTFQELCAAAWVRCTVAKDFMSYAPDEEMKFTFTLCGFEGTVPPERFFWAWKRTGDDGVAESGREPLASNATFVATAKASQPGFVRVRADIVDAAGKPFLAKSANAQRPLYFQAGACAGLDRLVPPSPPKDFAKMHAAALWRFARPQSGKTEKTRVEDARINGARVWRVSIPCGTKDFATGYLTEPDLEDATVKFPCRLEFAQLPAGTEQKPPAPGTVKTSEIRFVLGWDPGGAEGCDEAQCLMQYAKIVRALRHLKAHPQWNGCELSVGGFGRAAALAVWAAAAGEGVTRVECRLPEPYGPETWNACHFAALAPSGCLAEISASPCAAGGGSSFAAALWNAFSCDKRSVWSQGGPGSAAVRHNYRGRDVRLEKIAPLEFVRIDEAHRLSGPAIKDPVLAFTDAVAVEVVFDCAKPETFDQVNLTRMAEYAKKDLVPIIIYGRTPGRRPGGKTWQKFLVSKTGRPDGRTSLPIYADGGMDLPAPGALPWFRVAGHDGVLRYSGGDQAVALRTAAALGRRLPKPDPMFAYRRPALLAESIAKMKEAGTKPSRILKALETDAHRLAKTDPARAGEARLLAIGMRQAVLRRLLAARQNFAQRPGQAIADVQDAVAEWPELASHPEVLSFRRAAEATPDFERLAKLERTLAKLLAWNPEKPADIRRRDGELAALRAKIARFSKSRNSRVQGEAMAMEADLDGQQQNQQDGGDGNAAKPAAN